MLGDSRLMAEQVFERSLVALMRGRCLRLRLHQLVRDLARYVEFDLSHHSAAHSFRRCLWRVQALPRLGCLCAFLEHLHLHRPKSFAAMHSRHARLQHSPSLAQQLNHSRARSPFRRVLVAFGQSLPRATKHQTSPMVRASIADNFPLLPSRVHLDATANHHFHLAFHCHSQKPKHLETYRRVNYQSRQTIHHLMARDLHHLHLPLCLLPCCPPSLRPFLPLHHPSTMRPPQPFVQPLERRAMFDLRLQ